MIGLHVKLLATVAAALLVFIGGYLVKASLEEAAQADILRQQIRGMVESQDAMAASARKTETALSQARALNANLNRKWTAIRAKIPDPCLLDADRIGLLRDATAPLGDAPR